MAKKRKSAGKAGEDYRQPTRSMLNMQLGSKGVRLIQKFIDTMDPDHSFVRLDVRDKTVKYSDEIRQHEVISTFEGEEEPVRAFIVCWLCSVANYLPANLELEKRYSIGRPKVGAELDILINLADGTPYALVEVKSPKEYDIDPDKFIKGQLFDIAPHEPGCQILSYATVEIFKGAMSLSLLKFAGQASLVDEAMLPS